MPEPSTPKVLVPRDPLHHAPWAACLLWAGGDKEAVARFRAETGCTWTPPKNALDRMIDDATGHSGETARRFIEWFNANVYGIDENGEVIDRDEP